MKGSYSPFSMLLLSAMTFAWHSADAQNTRIAMSAIAPHTGLKVDQYAINASRFSGKSEAVGGNAPDAERGGGPVNDNCIGAITLTPSTSCVPVTGTIAGATQSIPAITCNAFTGNADSDVWYKFTATATSHTIVVDGSLNFDAVVDLRSGACDGVNIGCADATVDDGVEQIVAGGLSIGTQYYVRVYDYFVLEPATTTFTICVYGTPPPPSNDQCSTVIAQQLAVPGSLNFSGNTSGATTTNDAVAASLMDDGIPKVWHKFTTSACSNLTIEYCGTTPAFDQIYVALNTNCPSDTYTLGTYDFTSCGDNNGTVVFASLPAGTYYMPVGLFGAGSTGAYSITVSTTSCATAPPNDGCAGAISLTPATVCNPVTGDVAASTQSIAPLLCNTFTSATALDVWYSFVATSTSHIVHVDGSLSFDAVVDLRSGACDGVNIGCADATVADGIEEIVANGLTIGTTYHVRVYSYGAALPATTTFDICIIIPSAPPANDQCSTVVAQPLGVPGSLSFSGTTVGATTTNDAVALSLMDDGIPKVWHKFTTSACSNLTIEYCGTTPAFDQIYVALNTNCPSDTYILGTYDFTSCGDNNGTVVFANLPAGTYYMPIGLFGPGSTGAYSITVSTTICGGPPVNDDCVGAISLTPAAVCNPVSGNVAAATQSLAPLVCNTFTSLTAFDLWYSFVATSTDHIVHVDGSLSFDAVVDLRSGACDGVNIGCADATVADGIEEIAATGLTIGATYYVRVYSYGAALPATTTFDICIITPGLPPVNNDCGAAYGLAVYLPGDCPANAASGDNSTATQDAAGPSCDPTTTGFYQDVWYTFNSGPNALVTITFDNGTMTDWVVVVNDACGGTEVPGSCTIGPIAPFDVTVAPNTDHWVRVYSNTQFGTGGTFSICISAAVITGQTEVPASSAWSVFPNPSSGSLNVVWKEASSDVWIELFDLSGRAVFTDRAMLSTGATHALSFTNPLAQGTYSLRLTGPNGASEQRVVVN